MTREEAIKAIKDYFKENDDDFNTAIEDLDSYNGYLGDDRYYNMEDLDEFYSNVNPSEILTRAFYGYDEDYTDENGDHPEPFNPNSEFFRFNGDGNLVSAGCKDYSDLLDDYFVEDYLDNINNMGDIPDEVQEIIDNIED